MKYRALDEDFIISPDSLFFDSISSVCAAIVSLEAIINPRNLCSFEKGQKITLDGRIQPGVFLYPHMVFQQYQARKIEARTITRELLRIMILGCYEKVKHKNDQSSLFEFFRHVRNGCAHDNRFRFNEDQPSVPGIWRTLRIGAKLKGSKNPLSGKPVLFDFLAPGDVIGFLGDMDLYIQHKLNDTQI